MDLMSMSKVILIVGPSGAGKDTLLKAARTQFRDRTKVRFEKRYITRASDDNEENFVLSIDTFKKRLDKGFFEFTWQAHGLHYGIQKDTRYKGIRVISTSRSKVGYCMETFHRCQVIYVGASKDILYKRLRERGRESILDIEKRINQSSPTLIEPYTYFDNGSDLRDTVPRFNTLLESLINELAL